MNYYSKSQESTIQDIIYPRPHISMSFPHHKKNLQMIKDIQCKNKEIQKEIESYIEPTPYKLKRFENIPSILNEKTKEWVRREAKMRKSPLRKEYTLGPANNKLYKSPYYDPYGFEDSVYNGSLFEKYYANRLQEIRLEMLKKNKENAMRNASNSHIAKTNFNINNERDRDKIIVKEHHKSPVPKAKDVNVLLPKINRNYVLENRRLITDNKIPRKKFKSFEEKTMHKYYGKTPEYLKMFKLEEEMKKEYIKLKKEEAKYPKGTRLIPEGERLKTLEDLIKTKKEIDNLLEKMPITLRSLSTQNKRKELEKKANEIDKSIEIFSKKRVFVLK